MFKAIYLFVVLTSTHTNIEHVERVNAVSYGDIKQCELDKASYTDSEKARHFCAYADLYPRKK